jgi:hypothetical protein
MPKRTFASDTDAPPRKKQLKLPFLPIPPRSNGPKTGFRNAPARTFSIGSRASAETRPVLPVSALKLTTGPALEHIR